MNRIEEIDHQIDQLIKEKNLILSGPFAWFDEIDFGYVTEISVTLEDFPGGCTNLMVNGSEYRSNGEWSSCVYETNIYHNISHQEIINKFLNDKWNVISMKESLTTLTALLTTTPLRRFDPCSLK